VRARDEAVIVRSVVDGQPMLGPKFRALRMERGLSLSAVAQETQISSSFLSLFENGKSDITFGRLARLTAFYAVSITDVLPSPEPSEQAVVRSHARRRIDSLLGTADVYLLTHDLRHSMMPLLITIAADGAPCETTVSDGGEVVLFVLSGELEVTCEDEAPIRLARGDAYYYATDRQRALRTIGGESAEVIAVRTPPSL
jgi:transcriptional regulator with XRE-family HTH domain